jgi:hypothetical protein
VSGIGCFHRLVGKQEIGEEEEGGGENAGQEIEEAKDRRCDEEVAGGGRSERTRIRRDTRRSSN